MQMRSACSGYKACCDEHLQQAEDHGSPHTITFTMTYITTTTTHSGRNHSPLSHGCRSINGVSPCTSVCWQLCVMLTSVLPLLLLASLPPAHAQLQEDSSEGCTIPGFFYSNCTGVCHCLNGANQCRPDDGSCIDLQCDRGYTGAPYCQQNCSRGFFSNDCRLECHCPVNVTCDRVNGLCLGADGNNECSVDWTGPGCQIRRPRLVDEPVVDAVFCEGVTLHWQGWNEEQDVGNSPVGSYTIAYMMNSTNIWRTIVPDIAHEPVTIVYVSNITDLNRYTTYSFRVTSNREDNGKKVAGRPGPRTDGVIPACYIPTTAGPDPTTIVVTTQPPITSPRETTSSPTTTPAPTTTPTAAAATTTFASSTTPNPTTTPRPTTTQEPTTVTTQPPETTTPLLPPGSPRDLTVSLDSFGVTYAHWNEPEGDTSRLIGYEIRYRRVGTGTCQDDSMGFPITRTMESDVTSYGLHDVEEWTRYHIEVRAYNEAGASLPAITVYVTQEVAPSGRVRDLRQTGVTSTTLTFSWAEVTCTQSGGEFLTYQIQMTKGPTVFTNTSTSTQFTAIDLTPYTEYSIQVRFVNRAGAGPWSEAVTATTFEGLPSPPQDLRIEDTDDTSLVVQWERPANPNGRILEYHVMFWITGDEEVTSSLDVSPSAAPQAVLERLQPYTEYTIKVQASTIAGPGEATETITARTLASLPTEPRNLREYGRNRTCITIEWDEPETPNGLILQYKVRYAAVSLPPYTSEQPGTNHRFSACSLLDASRYRFQVSAETAQGYGQSSSIDLWSEVGTPAPPPRPTTKSTANTNVTITLQPVTLTTGPVSGYFVVVSRLPDVSGGSGGSRRRRRALPDPVSVLPLTGYTAAELAVDEVLTTREFVVGDGAEYGGYENPLLAPGARYDVHYVVASSHPSLPDVVKMSYSSLSPPALTRALVQEVTTPQPATTTEDPEDDSTTLIIIICCVIGGIILLALLILLIFCLCRRYRCCVRNDYKEEPLKGDTPNGTGNWLKYYTANYYNQPNPKKGNWSDIRDLNESRHVTVNEPDRDPDDLQVADIQNKTPVISFRQEYERLPQGQTHEWKVASRDENKNKNRFDHLLAYDHSRVILKRKSGFDYINASYIHGYKKRAAYIAAQSPFNDETVEDFWFMVYQEKSSQIVFIAQLIEDGTVKCEQYWMENATVKFGDMVVRHVSTQIYASFTVRSFELSKVSASKNARIVTQYHFTDWPDHGVPDDAIPFLEFRSLVRGEAAEDAEGATPRSTTAGPPVVHCGTGVSRSAVFIAVESLLEQARQENCVNVYKFVNTMRRHRPMMVRTLKQYHFIYDALFEALITNLNIVDDDLKGNYRLLSNVNPATNKTYFREQFEILERYVAALDPNRCKDGAMAANRPKNRFQSILPPDAYRPKLRHSPDIRAGHGPGVGDYINAVYVDSFMLKNEFILTQTPLANTVADFWQMIYEQQVTTIVMLDSSDMKEDTCVQYFPVRRNQQKYGMYYVQLDATQEDKNITVTQLKLSCELDPTAKPRTVRHYQFEAWRMYGKVPWSREGVINMMEEVEAWREESGSMQHPLVVHCMDGANHSGLYVACHILCEKMQIRGEVDVFHTIKQIKKRRQHVVNTLDQYKFCFKLLWDYLNTRLHPMTGTGGYSSEDYLDTYSLTGPVGGRGGGTIDRSTRGSQPPPDVYLTGPAYDNPSYA